MAPRGFCGLQWEVTHTTITLLSAWINMHTELKKPRTGSPPCQQIKWKKYATSSEEFKTTYFFFPFGDSIWLSAKLYRICIAAINRFGFLIPRPGRWSRSIQSNAGRPLGGTAEIKTAPATRGAPAEGRNTSRDPSCDPCSSYMYLGEKAAYGKKKKKKRVGLFFNGNQMFAWKFVIHGFETYSRQSELTASCNSINYVSSIKVFRSFWPYLLFRKGYV